jgi:peptidoglycan hydrolase CwlO-like protein
MEAKKITVEERIELLNQDYQNLQKNINVCQQQIVQSGKDMCKIEGMIEILKEQVETKEDAK